MIDTGMTTPQTAAEVAAALHQYYRDRSVWIAFDELRVGTGYGKDAEQRVGYDDLPLWAA